jgi:hypothetical protein
MSINNTMTDCRLCSLVSKANGEDPIGTVGTYNHWLIVELALPWSQKILLENPRVQPILALCRELSVEYGAKLRPMAIAPDREYSQPNYTRVLSYHRPARLFSKFEKQEFILPEDQIGSLATALLKQPNELPRFEQYQQQTSHTRELMVCTHGNVDVACARFGYPIYQKLRSEYAAASKGQLRVWRCSHFGGHNFAPTLVELPSGRFWGHLEPEVLELLVHHNGSVTGLRPFYRGWAGLTRFEQIAEREIWMREGWDWLDYYKAGQILAKDEANEEWDADWALVRVDFISPDGNVSGAYEARVEVSGSVMTMWNSGNEQSLEEVKQYRVSSLVRVASSLKSDASKIGAG